MQLLSHQAVIFDAVSRIASHVKHYNYRDAWCRYGFYYVTYLVYKGERWSDLHIKLCSDLLARWSENYFYYYTFTWSRKRLVSAVINLYYSERKFLTHVHLFWFHAGAIDIVTKDFPSSIECKRTKQQRQDERDQASTDKLVVIYIELTWL